MKTIRNLGKRFSRYFVFKLRFKKIKGKLPPTRALHFSLFLPTLTPVATHGEYSNNNTKEKAARGARIADPKFPSRSVRVALRKGYPFQRVLNRR